MSVDPATILNPASAVITIEDNDGKLLSCTISYGVRASYMHHVLAVHELHAYVCGRVYSWYIVIILSFSPLQLGVMIGFSPTTYTVSEDVGTYILLYIHAC